MGRIGPVIQPVFQGAVGWFARRLEDCPVRPEQPAMVAASYARGVDQPVLQRRAAMWTMQLQETHSAAPVAKHYQLLAEDLDPLGQVLQFLGETDRLPKAAQIFAAWCVGTDMGEFGIFLGYLPMQVSAVWRRKECGPSDHGRPP
jgi:hypothetical protein